MLPKMASEYCSLPVRTNFLFKALIISAVTVCDISLFMLTLHNWLHLCADSPKNPSMAVPVNWCL